MKLKFYNYMDLTLFLFGPALQPCKAVLGANLSLALTIRVILN